MSARSEAKEIAARIEEAVAGIAEEFGYQIKVKRTTYSEDRHEFRLEAARINDDGSVETAEAREWRASAEYLDLKPEWLGKQFIDGGDEFVVLGLRSRRAKRRVLAEKLSDGRHYCFTADAIRRKFEKLEIVG